MWQLPYPHKHSGSGWMGLWAIWSSWKCPCSLQEAWTRWPFKVPSSRSNLWLPDSMIIYAYCWVRCRNFGTRQFLAKCSGCYERGKKTKIKECNKKKKEIYLFILGGKSSRRITLPQKFHTSVKNKLLCFSAQENNLEHNSRCVRQLLRSIAYYRCLAIVCPSLSYWADSK